MEVSVSLYGYIRDVVPEGKVKVTLPPGATVGVLLAHLAQTFGERFRERVLDEDGQVLPSVRVVVGGVLAESPTQPLAPGGEAEVAVVIVPPVIGGATTLTPLVPLSLRERGRELLPKGRSPFGLPPGKPDAERRGRENPLRRGEAPSALLPHGYVVFRA